MPRRARIHFVSLRSSLVNLPISLYGPLLERGVRPQGLAVHLSLHSNARGVPARKTPAVQAYVGWTGMASASSLAHFNSSDAADKGLETVEIDPQFAQGLGFALDDIVEIGLLHNLSYAKSAATEPVTADDWEILELHASHVESTLLSQVRVVNVGQEIDVWVLGRTRVRLQVVSLEPSANGKALLLTNSTEVSIAPKLRQKANGASARGKPDAKTTAVNGSGPSKEVAEHSTVKKRARILRVLPLRLLPGSQPDAVTDHDVTVAYVSRASLVNEGLIPSEPRNWHVQIKRMRPPADPTQEHAAAPSSAIVPRVLFPNAESGQRPPTPSSLAPNDDLVVMWSPDVPQGHIVLRNTVAGVEDWDLVKILFVRESTASPPSNLQSTSPSVHKRRTKIDHGLAGVDDLLRKCSEFCLTNFAIHACSRRVRGVPGLLVTGRSGAGKTSLVQAVAKSLQEDPKTFAYTFYADLSKYTEMPISRIKLLLKFWMAKATWHRPCVLVLDNLDKLMNAELEHADSFRARHITELFLATFGSSARAAAPDANGVVLLASAESQAALHPALSSSHVFREVVALKPPGKDARKDIIGQLVRERMATSDIVEDIAAPLNFTVLATQTEGYSVTDLKDLVARALHRAAIRSSRDHDEDVETTLIPEDFTTAQVDFVPLSLRDVKLQKSDVVWADIGGMSETKRVLRETLEWPTKYGPIFAQSPLRLRSGLLLYGYPGCGKTLLASAVAKECGLNFISIKGPELLNKYIGASEKSVRDLFERASAAKPCVLFFDEFDSIAPKRGHDSTGVTDRVVNQMLTQMDGAEGLDGVYVLAATSRPDLIDSALLRPGRLDKSLLCDMPGVEDRKDILEALGRKINISSTVDLDGLARDTEGFSGADLQALMYNAHLEVIHDTIASEISLAKSKGKDRESDRAEDPAEVKIEYTALGRSETTKVISRAEESAFQRRLQRILESQSTTKGSRNVVTEVSTKKREIDEEHLRRVLGTTRPSVPPEERERLRRIYGAFVSDRSGEMPNPPDGTGVGSRVSLM